MADIHWQSARELAAAVAGRQISPVEIVERLLQRAERLDGRFRSYVTVFGDEARTAARAAAKAIAARQLLGPLHGVPVAVKDLFAVAGSPTTAGSPLLTEPAAQDCTVVTRLRAAGAIILGKLNLHEFAYGPEGINNHWGTCWNPWDQEIHRLPGGSSSGSGVAVAAGLTPVGMGSDTGGSIRIPAACCGTVGLKPTYGRVSRAGVWPLAWSMDHVGPLTRSVGDAALILSVISGHDPADATSSQESVPDYLAELDQPVRSLKIGVFSEYVAAARPEVREAVLGAAKTLEGLGCAVEEVSIPIERYGLATSFAVFGSEAYALHEPMVRRHADKYAPDVRRRILSAAFLTARDYLVGQRARRLIRDKVNEILQRVDCLLAPTLPISAPPVGAKEVQIRNDSVPVRSALTMFTRLFNLTGHPVLAVPCGFGTDGMPLSLQLVGRSLEEATILRLANAYEAATDWHQRRPDVPS
jgi:aspartyl-tRNA(Asn)/glutamyl-tRNA(Gln) amidotransferase subunit A